MIYIESKSKDFVEHGVSMSVLIGEDTTTCHMTLDDPRYLLSKQDFSLLMPSTNYNNLIDFLESIRDVATNLMYECAINRKKIQKLLEENIEIIKDDDFEQVKSIGIIKNDSIIS